MNYTKLFRINIALVLGVLCLQIHVFAKNADGLLNQLKDFPEVVSVQKIENNPFFKESYEIYIEQFLNHKNPSEGKFRQRVILSDYNRYSPMVFVAEGYDAEYAMKPSYINELSKILEANQLVVEHRFFGKSVPEGKNWGYLTMQSASDDLHRIQRIFKRLYNNQNKWIVTGISKGGTNTLAYKAFYPDDADIWVPYVGPVNFAVEDGRHEKFLKAVGSQTCREKLLQFQRSILTQREAIQPLFDSLVKARNYSFRIPPEQVLDYCVLEYSFAFWQWGTNCAAIPADSTPIRVQLNHLVEVCSPDYFSNEGTAPMQSFFIQAAKEMGYYGYDVKALKPLLKIKDAEGYLSEIFIPEGLAFKFDKKTSKFIEKTVNANGKHVLMIYGETDPWSASGFNLKNPKSGAVKMVIPKASHRVRIENMPLAEKAQVYMLLESWLNED